MITADDMVIMMTIAIMEVIVMVITDMLPVDNEWYDDSGDSGDNDGNSSVQWYTWRVSFRIVGNEKSNKI